MTGPPHANGLDGGEETEPDSSVPASGRANAKTLKHQVREVNRMVDNAVENLEQVLRALKYIEKDL